MDGFRRRLVAEKAGQPSWRSPRDGCELPLSPRLSNRNLLLDQANAAIQAISVEISSAIACVGCTNAIVDGAGHGGRSQGIVHKQTPQSLLGGGGFPPTVEVIQTSAHALDATTEEFPKDITRRIGHSVEHNQAYVPDIPMQVIPGRSSVNCHAPAGILTNACRRRVGTHPG